MNDISQLRVKFQQLSPIQKRNYLKSLSTDDLKVFYQHPELFLFDKQIIPNGNWRYLLLMCGRGFGKTTAGGAHVASQIYQGVKYIGLCGAKYSDVEQDMIPSILKWFSRDFVSKIERNSQQHILHLPNGAVIKYYSSDTEIRGPNLQLLWCDEICKWSDSIPEKIKECFDLLDMTVRVGDPKIIITSTPKPFSWFNEFSAKVNSNNKSYKIITGTMFDNPFLPKSFIDAMIEKYGGTRLGRQEIYGEILTDHEGALWNYSMFEPRVASPPQMRRIIVAVDPAVTADKNSDETGIIVAGLGVDNKVYILEDLSGRYSPYDWAKKAISAYENHKADKIIAEKNNGGDLVESNIKSVSRMAPVKLVHASRGKIVRAEPVAALYEQKKVFHIKEFKTLEDQCCSYTGNAKDKSPDRMDAMVYAVTELILTMKYANRNADWAPTF